MTLSLGVVGGGWGRRLRGGVDRGLALPGTGSGVWHMRLAAGAGRRGRGTVGFQSGANVVRSGTGTR